jgi:hypothetical protein
LYKFAADTNMVNGTVQFFTDENGDDLQDSLTFNATNLPEKINVVFTADEGFVVTSYGYDFENGNGSGGIIQVPEALEYTLTLDKEDILAKGAGAWTFCGYFEQDEEETTDQYTISTETVTGGTITLYDGSKLTKDAETEDDVKSLTEIKSGTTFTAANLPTRIVALYKPESDAWGVEKATVKVDGEELTDVTISGFVSAFLDNSAKCLNLTFDEDDAGTYTFTGEFMKLEDVTILYRFSADTRYNSTASEGGTITFNDAETSYTDVEDTLDGMEDITVFFKADENHTFHQAYVWIPGAENYVALTTEQYENSADTYYCTISADSDLLKIADADKSATYQWIFTADFDNNKAETSDTGNYVFSSDTATVNCKIRFGTNEAEKYAIDSLDGINDGMLVTITPYAGFKVNKVTVEQTNGEATETVDLTSDLKSDDTDFATVLISKDVLAKAGAGDYVIKVELERTALG